jgi:ATP-dependent DNA helicase 2 subunit 2
MGEACVTHAKKFDEASEVALSSLIWALHEVQSYAVARLVIKEGKDPVLVLLIPHIEPGFECLYDVPLPFAEDVRSYQFPPLDRVITVSGQTLSKHRFLPSDDLNEAMDAYVDAMDLSNYGIDEDGSVERGHPMFVNINSILEIQQSTCPSTTRTTPRYIV